MVLVLKYMLISHKMDTCPAEMVTSVIKYIEIDFR